MNIKNQKRQPNAGSSPPQHERAQAVAQKLDNNCQDDVAVQLEKLKRQQDKDRAIMLKLQQELRRTSQLRQEEKQRMDAFEESIV